MSRCSEYHRMSAVITAAVRHAFLDNRGKRVAAALGCSVITGKRIASTGRASPSFRQRLIKILDEAIAANERELCRLRRELRALEYEEAHPEAYQVARVDRPTAGAAAGSAERTEDDLLVKEKHHEH